MYITKNEKKYLQRDLFKAIQENRDLTSYVQRAINPFGEYEKPTKKDVINVVVEPVIEAKEVKPKAVKWTKVYEEALLHASKDSTSNKRRTLEYLEQTLPFSKAAIKRKAYRLGLKWKKGKLVDAKA